MRRTGLTLLVPVALLLAACGDTPREGALTAVEPPRLSLEGPRFINLRDECDPTTFNAAIGPGTCTRTGAGVPFSAFIAQLTATHAANAWRIIPPELHVMEGTTLPVMNTGGETHTYTEVKQFGGGIVPLLNDLSGNTTVAPECTQLTQADFIAAGQQVNHTFDDEGLERYQCCIHPWMRQVVSVRASS